MFKLVTTEGVELGIVESVNYIKISPSTGCYIAAKPEEAVGVAFRGTAYNLYGRAMIRNTPTVFVTEVDAGDTITRLKEETKSLDEQLAETDEAAIALYEANIILEQHNAEQDEAIIEIYEMMENTTNG